MEKTSFHRYFFKAEINLVLKVKLLLGFIIRENQEPEWLPCACEGFFVVRIGGSRGAQVFKEISRQLSGHQTKFYV